MISKEEVKRISKLARLELTEQEEIKMEKDISSILDYFEMLNGIDTSLIEPTYHSAEEFMPKKLRQDISEEKYCSQKIISQFPKREKNYLKVKTILEQYGS